MVGLVIPLWFGLGWCFFFSGTTDWMEGIFVISDVVTGDNVQGCMRYIYIYILSNIRPRRRKKQNISNQVFW